MRLFFQFKHVEACDLMLLQYAAPSSKSYFHTSTVCQSKGDLPPMQYLSAASPPPSQFAVIKNNAYNQNLRKTMLNIEATGEAFVVLRFGMQTVVI